LAIGNSKTKLDYNLLSVRELFQSDHYVVPRYQRGYAWGEEQVGNLLEDLDLAFDEAADEEYLLGQIIVCPSETPAKGLDVSQWDLIDGQQRSTTLYLMMFYFYSRLKTINANERTISAWHLLSTHEVGDVEVAKVTPAANGDKVLFSLVNGKPIPDLEGSTFSNIVGAWNKIKDFFDGYSDEKIGKFSKYFIDQVVVIRLELEDAKHALRIFSRVNNRGLVLDDSDIIKNYLFQNVTDQEFDALASQWTTAADSLDSSRLKRTSNMDFLLKLKAGIMTGKSISTRNLFTTLAAGKKNDDGESGLLTDSHKVREFARSLPADAKMIKQLSQNNAEQTGGYDDFSHFAYLRKVVQHFEVLLAGSHLTESAYRNLNQIVQDRMVLAVLSKTVKEFERDVHPWAHKISLLDVNPSKEELLAVAKDSGVFNDLGSLFDVAFIKVASLRYTTQSHQEVLRYLLARASKVFQEKIDSLQTPMKDYMQTSGKSGAKRGFDLDHIFPQSPSKFDHFPKPDDWDSMSDDEKSSAQSKLIHSLGNLALLHPKDNREQSDAFPWDSDKVDNYENSELYLNRLLVTDSKILKTNPELISSFGLGQMPKVDNWTLDWVDIRTELIWNMVKSDILRSFEM
jgi:hypothetical protein